MFVPLLKLHHLLGQRFVGLSNSAILIMGEDADTFQGTFCRTDRVWDFCVKDADMFTYSGTQGCADCLGIVGPAVIFGILALQLILMIMTDTNSAIHDILSDTVTVDLASQMIFSSEQELLAYKKKAAENVSRQSG